MKKTIYTTPTIDLLYLQENQDVMLASAEGENYVTPGEDWLRGGMNL